MTIPPCLHARLRELLKAALRPPRPALPYRFLLREINDMLIYGIAPATPTVQDVVSHELAVSVDGGVPTNHTVAPGGSIELALADNATATVAQVDIDDAGNRSELGAPLTFTASDTLPPPAPGVPTVQLLREE